MAGLLTSLWSGWMDTWKETYEARCQILSVEFPFPQDLDLSFCRKTMTQTTMDLLCAEQSRKVTLVGSGAFMIDS